MAKNTELIFIIDESGSMEGLESDTIGGFNSLIEKQKKEDGKCLVTTCMFNSSNHTIHDRVELQNIRKLTRDDYIPGGCTALLDAMGETMEKTELIYKYIRPEDVPEKTMYVVITDGLENASRKFNAKTIKEMVKKHQEEDKWEFIFLGANMDAIQTAETYGIHRDRACSYSNDKKGVAVNFDCLSKAVYCCRMDLPFDETWSKPIDEHRKARENRENMKKGEK